MIQDRDNGECTGQYQGERGPEGQESVSESLSGNSLLTCFSGNHPPAPEVMHLSFTPFNTPDLTLEQSVGGWFRILSQ